MWLYLALVAGMVLCGIQAVRAQRLIVAVLWLAGVSVLVAVILYAMNAPLVSAIELSVGAGLVTVIFVFAIGLAGELTRDLPSLIPRPLAWIVSIVAVGWIGWLLWPAAPAPTDAETVTLQTVLWESRAVDMWVQIALILAGVLGILNLVVDAPAGKEAATLERIATPDDEVAA